MATIQTFWRASRAQRVSTKPYSASSRGMGGRAGGLRWHSFRRFGAAQLHHLGLTLLAICLYGGWKSQKIARLYTRAPPYVFFRKPRPSSPPLGASEPLRVSEKKLPNGQFQTVSKKSESFYL